jgi:hypothetical protein
MEVGVVFFMGVSNHIEISKEHPWSAMRGSYGPKLIEESRPLIRRVSQNLLIMMAHKYTSLP